MKLTLAILLMIPVTLSAQPKPRVEEGKFLIQREHLNENQIVNLDGEWEFYWDRFLTPDSFRVQQIVKEYRPVPLKWDKYVVAGENLPIRGFCTYRLVIRNPQLLDDLLIKIPGIATASKIWVNGEIVSAQGVVATNERNSRAERLHHFIKLPAERSIELVVHASNYEYSFPGISHTVIMGHEIDLVAKEKLENDFEMIEIGCLLIMIFYHLALYFQLSRNRSYLLLCLLCGVVLIRAMATYHSSLLLYRLFPSFNFSSVKTLEFAATYAVVMLLPMFIQSLFKGDTPKIGIRIFQVISTAFILLVLATPPYIFGQAINIFHVVMTCSFVFVLWVIFKAIRNKRQGAWLIFTGLLFCCVFIEFEMLMVSNVIPEKLFPFPNPVGIGVVIFLLFQSLALSVRFATAFKDVEELTHALEKRVEKRTEELSRANLVKDKLFSIISHDLRSPLNSLRGLLDLTSKDGITHQELQLLLPSIRQNLNGSLQLLDNLLNWASSQMKGMKTKTDRIRMAPLVEENFNLYRTIAKNKNIKLINHISAHAEVIADANITKLIIRNLVSNGIKFTPSGGVVEVSAITIKEEMEICVSDTGVGITQDFRDRIFEIDFNRTTRGTNNEKGTGIGLLLCREFVEKNGGKLWVESQEGKGSKFKFTLPVSRTERVHAAVKELA